MQAVQVKVLNPKLTQDEAFLYPHGRPMARLV